MEKKGDRNSHYDSLLDDVTLRAKTLAGFSGGLLKITK